MMNIRARLYALVTAILLCLPMTFLGAQELQAVPALTGHIVDNAQMLSTEEQQKINDYLREFEKKTGNQIVVFTTPTTQPETIEQYSIRVVETWKLGRKNIDDGVLLLIAPKNPKSLKRLRLETGIGTQGVLTDVQSKRILQDVIAPYFSKKLYYDGIVNGVARITSILSKESFPPPEDAQTSDDEDINWPVILIFVFIIAAGSFFNRFSRRTNYRRWGSNGVILGSPWDNPYHGYDDIGSSDDHFSGGGGSFDGGGASGDWDD